jgi:hypothetical protein
VETPDTANPILDQVVTTITVNDTRDGAEISYIAWDGDGDGYFDSTLTGRDGVWNYSGGNRVPPKSESHSTKYSGVWSGADIVRHLEVSGSYKNQDGSIKTYTYKKEFPLQVKYVSELEHNWSTDPAKAAEANARVLNNIDSIATWLSTGSPCVSTLEEVRARLEEACSWTDTEWFWTDDSNAFGARSMSQNPAGIEGYCVYETPFNATLETVAPDLIDNPYLPRK